MNTAKMLEVAENARPDLLEKTARAMRIMEAMGSPFTGDTAREMGEILDNGMRKTASVGDAAKNVALITGGMVLTGIGTAIASDLYESAKRGLSRTANLKRIMDANPDLHHEDQAKVKGIFTMVHRFGPEFTADPMMGGAIIRQINAMPDASPKVIMDLLAARKNMHEGSSKMYALGNPQGASSLMPRPPAAAK